MPSVAAGHKALIGIMGHLDTAAASVSASRETDGPISGPSRLRATGRLRCGCQHHEVVFAFPAPPVPCVCVAVAALRRHVADFRR